jgi:hypothetical protein
MEREAEARAATRRDHLEQDLAAERRAHAELRDRIDASRLRIEVIDESGPLAAVATNDTVKARFIESEKQTLIAPLKKPKPQSRWPWEIDIYGESRNQTRFLTELNEYVAALDERWLPALANAAVDREVTELLLVARNNAEVGVSGVEIQVHLPDDFDAAWDEGDLWQEGLPDRPAAWGSYNAMTFLPDISPSSPMSRSPGEIERRDGRLVITWDPLALTSKRNQPLAPVRLFVPDTYAGRTIKVVWNAASVPGGEPITGELALTFGPDPIEPEKLLLPRERPA